MLSTWHLRCNADVYVCKIRRDQGGGAESDAGPPREGREQVRKCKCNAQGDALIGRLNQYSSMSLAFLLAWLGAHKPVRLAL